MVRNLLPCCVSHSAGDSPSSLQLSLYWEVKEKPAAIAPNELKHELTPASLKKSVIVFVLPLRVSFTFSSAYLSFSSFQVPYLSLIN